MTDKREDVTGVVFDIQHYSIHDGPGIRTNVFVKGCPLRCIWCSNPESQLPQPQLMYRYDRCVGCGACIPACPHDAIKRNEDKVVTDRSLCDACGACIPVCPVPAREITGEVMTAGDAYEDVMKDAIFYREDGGVTVTGGEAFAHPEFTGALISLCKEGGITTAIETCGAVSWNTMRPILAETDVVLYDIKQMDSALHKEYVGVGNERILENLKHISDETNCRIIVRCPVIPPCNDSIENMRALGEFLQENKIRVSEINLLPYHNLGEGKRMQLEPGEEGFQSHKPSDEEMEALKNVLREYGYLVK